MVSPKHGRHVLLDDALLSHKLPLLLLLLVQPLVHLEVLNVLRVGEVLELGVLVVVLLPVVDLVLVLVVAVVAGPRPHVGQGLAGVDEGVPLLAADVAVVVGVEQVQQLVRDLVDAALRDVLVGRVVQAVRLQQLRRVQVAVAVEVVQGEEGGGVEVAGVVFLWWWPWWW